HLRLLRPVLDPARPDAGRASLAGSRAAARRPFYHLAAINHPGHRRTTLLALRRPGHLVGIVGQAIAHLARHRLRYPNGGVAEEIRAIPGFTEYQAPLIPRFPSTGY